MENLDNNVSSISPDEDVDTMQTKELQSSVEKAFLVKSSEKIEQKNEEQLISAARQIKKPEEYKGIIPGGIKLDKFNTVGAIYSAIEEGFPKETSKAKLNFPHPQYWIGPRFLATWVFPLVLIKKTRDLLKVLYKITTPYQQSNFSVNKAETIYTATQKALRGNSSMRFFGARFMAIWVFPLGITAIFIQYLLINPLLD